MCWENASETYYSSASSRALVQNAIQATWESHSQVKFTGWNQCPSSFFNGIRIGASQDLHEDDGAHLKGGLGSNVAGIKDGMVLNFRLENWSPTCSSSESVRNNCIKWIAIHEFGHALGFAHEQNRSDTPSSCLKNPQGTPGNVIFTEWDDQSVMNYCYPNAGRGILSAIDILTVQTYYGRIPSYNDTTNKITIPVVRVGSDSYSATLSDSDGDERFTLDSFTSTTGVSSKPAVYHTSSATVNLPLVKVTDSRGKVTSLYSAIMKRHADGEFTILNHSLIQPVPRED